MFKGYRKLAVAVVAVVYAVAAITFPAAVLPSQDNIVAIIDTIVEAFPGVEEVPQGD